MPSHVVLFGSLLEVQDGPDGPAVKDALAGLGYQAVWTMWNGFDCTQDEPRRRGGVQIWRWTD